MSVLCRLRRPQPSSSSFCKVIFHEASTCPGTFPILLYSKSECGVVDIRSAQVREEVSHAGTQRPRPLCAKQEPRSHLHLLNHPSKVSTPCQAPLFSAMSG